MATRVTRAVEVDSAVSIFFMGSPDIARPGCRRVRGCSGRSGDPLALVVSTWRRPGLRGVRRNFGAHPEQQVEAFAPTPPGRLLLNSQQRGVEQLGSSLGS